MMKVGSQTVGILSILSPTTTFGLWRDKKGRIHMGEYNSAEGKTGKFDDDVVDSVVLNSEIVVDYPTNLTFHGDGVVEIESS